MVQCFVIDIRDRKSVISLRNDPEEKFVYLTRGSERHKYEVFPLLKRNKIHWVLVEV